MQVKCKCGNEWNSNALAENIEAGRIACKECNSTEIEIVAPKSKEELEKEADIARKKALDEANKKAAEAKAKEVEALANTPLNDEERAFIAKIAPMMNCGRPVDQPSPPEISRYGQLMARRGIT